MAQFTGASPVCPVDMDIVEILFAIPKVRIIGSIGMEKQVYFVALKTERVLLLVIVIKKLCGIRTAQQMIEKGAMDSMTRGAFLFGNVSMELGVAVTGYRLMTLVTEKEPGVLGKQ
jgi:hypothetical protein